MSYRDLRNFTEMMRALGYPRLISMENFRTPNFQLVAEVLSWLIKRYDPSLDLPTDIDTEQDRVIFIKSVAQYMATKAHIKLNTKKLYQADGYAVKELLKVTSILYGAQNHMHFNDAEPSDTSSSSINFDISSKINDLKLARQLSSDIIQKGAVLHELLGKEVDLREERSTVLGKQLELGDVEVGIKSAVTSVMDDIQKTEKNLENIASDEVNLDAKIDKKTQELERNQKRLVTLQSVRPQYLDEFEKLEEELSTSYQEFILKFRNLSTMEQLLEDMERAEHDKFLEKEQKLKEMARKNKDEEMRLGVANVADSDDEIFRENIPGSAAAVNGTGAAAPGSGFRPAMNGPVQPTNMGGPAAGATANGDTQLTFEDDNLQDNRPSARKMRPNAGRGEGRVFGTMAGGLSDEDDEELTSGSDDVDLQDDSDEDLELGDAGGGAGNRMMGAGGTDHVGSAGVGGQGATAGPAGSGTHPKSPGGGSEDDF